MSGPDGRQTCILMLSCIGAGPKYFLETSNEFSSRFKLESHLYFSFEQILDIIPIIESKLEDCVLFVFHDPESAPFGDVREPYERLIDRVPQEALKVTFPFPQFHPFWPFHAHEPRNDPNRPLNRHGQLPWYHYGDSYVLRLLAEGMPVEDVVEHYINSDVSKAVDLEKLMTWSLSLLERVERSSKIKICNYVNDKFREHMLFDSINHANNRLLLYATNQLLTLTECPPIGEHILDRLLPLVGVPNPLQMPIHPSIPKFFDVKCINENTRYMYDRLNYITFGEYIKDYIYFR